MTNENETVYEKMEREAREKGAEDDREYAFKMGVLLILGRLAELVAPDDPVIVRAITLINQGNAAACEELEQGLGIAVMIAQASREELDMIKRSAEATLAKRNTEPTP